MLLAIDVGNTNITLGLFEGEKLLRTWRMHTDRHATADQLGTQWLAMLSDSLPKGVCIASVVPPLDEALLTACRSYLHCEPVVVGDPKVQLGIRNRYKRPEEVGADRLVNAVAVHTLYRKAAIVVDFGTATTFDCVSVKGDYLGGAICPGMELAGEWLATHTAKLPRVTFHQVPPRAMGQTTKESLQSGLFWGYTGLIEGLLTCLKNEVKSNPLVVLTGGLAPVIGPHLKGRFVIRPDLTLEGLRIIWERNKGETS